MRHHTHGVVRATCKPLLLNAQADAWVNVGSTLDNLPVSAKVIGGEGVRLKTLDAGNADLLPQEKFLSKRRS